MARRVQPRGIADIGEDVGGGPAWRANARSKRLHQGARARWYSTGQPARVRRRQAACPKQARHLSVGPLWRRWACARFDGVVMLGEVNKPQTDREGIKHLLQLALDEAMLLGGLLDLEAKAEEAGEVEEVARIRKEMGHSEHLIWQYLGRLPGEVGHVAASVECAIWEQRGKLRQAVSPAEAL